MYLENSKKSDFNRTSLGVISFSLFFMTVAYCTVKFVPHNERPLEELPLENNDLIVASEDIFDNELRPVSWSSKDSFNAALYGDAKLSGGDRSLELYRNPQTRAAVEWFYLRVTGRREVTMAILEAANREDIPFSLAFALAHTESRYNVHAKNYNTNGSIDRGLFQLNDRSFPHLKEEDFFTAATSARYGMSHLRFCLNIAGNDLTALAMYNAGVTRVRNDQTPRTTLAYVNRIVSYRANLERSFTDELSPFLLPVQQLEMN